MGKLASYNPIRAQIEAAEARRKARENPQPEKEKHPNYARNYGTNLAQAKKEAGNWWQKSLRKVLTKLFYLKDIEGPADFYDDQNHGRQYIFVARAQYGSYTFLFDIRNPGGAAHKEREAAKIAWAEREGFPLLIFDDRMPADDMLHTVRLFISEWRIKTGNRDLPWHGYQGPLNLYQK